MKVRPPFVLRFRDEAQFERVQEEAARAEISLNEYILRKIEGPKLDISRRQVK